MRRLRHRVSIYRESSDDGSETPTYALFMRAVPCNIVQVTGGETYRGRQIEATATHVVEMRKIDGLLPTMRLTESLDSRNLFIERITPRNGRDHMLDIQCRESVL